MIANKQEHIKNNVQKYTDGKYETPKIDLDIFFKSPKLIVHESLLTSELLEPLQADSVIIDLG